MYTYNSYPVNAGQLAPQGIFGSALGSIAGGAIGGHFGHKGLGSAIGGIAGGFLPFQAGPGYDYPAAQQYYEYPSDTGQLAPQGWFGNLVSGVSPVVGGLVGGKTGQAISGIGQAVGGILPFEAGPGMAPPVTGQLAPQGWFGNLVSGVSPVVGGLVGGKTGRAISGIGQAVGGILPFEAGPGIVPVAAPQLQPYGPIGEFVGSVGGGALGGFIGNHFAGDAGRHTGAGIGGGIGSWLGSFSPYHAGPGMIAPQGAYPQPMQYQPVPMGMVPQQPMMVH